jgi:hypothetical protein
MKKGQTLNRVPKKHLATRLPIPLLERVQRVASKQHAGMSAVVNQCVEAQIGILEKRFGVEEDCALKGSNLGPLPCEGNGLSLACTTDDTVCSVEFLPVLPFSRDVLPIAA